MIKKNIYLMYAITFLQGMVFYASIATLYRSNSGLSVFEITTIESISFALSLILEIPWGIAADKIGYKNTFVLCSFLYAFSKLIFYKADSYSMFLVERILLAVVCSGLSGVDLSILYLSSCEKDSQKITGIYTSLGTAGLLFSSAIYSVLQNNNYRLSALLTFITYTAAFLLSLFIVEVKEREKTSEFNTISNAVRQNLMILKNVLFKKRLILIVLATSFTGEAIHLLTTFINQLQYVKCGIDIKVMPLIYIVFTIAQLFSFLSDYITKKLGLLVTGSALFIITGVSAVLLSFTYSGILSVVLIIAVTFVSSVVSPLFIDMQNKLITEKNRATALSMISIAGDFVIIVVDLTLGKAADINISFAMFYVFVISMISFVLYLVSLKSDRA